MNRDKRRRTRRIDSHRGTLQTKGISNTTRDHARRATSQPITLTPTNTTQRPITRSTSTSKNTRRRTPQRTRIDTRILQSLPHHLQQQTLLRIHRQSLPRTNTKESSIKIPSTINKPTLTNPTIPLEHPPNIPTTIPRKRTNTINTTTNQPPQTQRRKHNTTKPTPHTHNSQQPTITNSPTTHTNNPTNPNTLTNNLTHQKPRKQNRRRKIKHNSRRQTQTQHTLQPITQFNPSQRIKTQILKRPLRTNLLKRPKPQNHRRMRTNKLNHNTLTLRPRKTRQPPPESQLALVLDGQSIPLSKHTARLLDLPDQRTRTLSSI